MTQIKENSINLYPEGNRIDVHWVPGHKDIGGNELVYMRAKETVAVVCRNGDIPIDVDKKEAVNEF